MCVKLYQLILNADDFGRHVLINRAVELGVSEGCLRSATLMPGGAAFDDAVAVAKRQPKLGVGIHFTLVNGNPILPPSAIPSLVDRNGLFYDNHAIFVKRFLTGKISIEEVRSELAAQLTKMRRTGLELTHVDSHQHMHTLPGIIDVVLQLAASAKIRAVRAPRTSVFYRGSGVPSLGQFIGRLGLGTLASISALKAERHHFFVPDHFAGIVAGEAFDESHLVDLLHHLKSGTTEVMLHPGMENETLQRDCAWEHDFKAEFSSITSIKIREIIDKNKIHLINFKDLFEDVL